MSEESTNFQEAWQSQAAETAGKIAKSMTKKFFEDGAEELVGAIGGALTGGLSTLIVDGIFDLIDPPDQDSILDYLNNIDDIVKNEINDALKKQTLDNISDTINGILVKLQTDYAPDRYPKDKKGNPKKDFKLDAKNSKKLISQYLEKYQGSITGSDGNSTDNIQVLIDTYPTSGFPIFVYAANLHLAIRQEIATLYYFNSKSEYDNWTTPNTGNIATVANQYAKDIITMWNGALQERLKQVSAPQLGTFGSVAGEQNSVTVTDGQNKVFYQQFGTPNFLTSIANDFLQLYYLPKVSNDLCQGFGSPYALRDSWDLIKANPLGNGMQKNGQKNLFPPSKEVITAVQDYYFIDGSKDIVLNPGDRLYSSGETFIMTLADDGNLTVTEQSTQTVFWTTGLKVASPGTAKLNKSGNLILNDGSGKEVWSSGTKGKAYMILDSTGMLHIRNSSDYSLIWSSNYGVLPEGYKIDTIANACLYTDPEGNSRIGLSYKGINSVQLYAGGSADGISWHNGPFQYPAEQTTQDPPGVGTCTQAMTTIFKGNGNTHIYLNTSDPYAGDFGGLVELDNDEVNTSTSPTGTLTFVGNQTYKFFTVYKGSGDDQTIYFFASDAIDDGSGELTPQSGLTTDDAPATLLLNFTDMNPTVVWKGASPNDDNSNSTLWSNVGGEVKQIPNGVFTGARPAVAAVNGTLYVVYIGTGDQRVWYTTWNKKQGWAKSPTELPEIIRTDLPPTVAAIDNRVYVYYKGQNNNRICCYVITQ